MNSILCVEPSASQRAAVGGLASRLGLGVAEAGSVADAMRMLEGESSYAAMVVSQHLKDGSGVQLIEGLRLLPHRVALPIAFVMAGRDLALARAALHAGATEVFLREEFAAMADCLATWASLSDTLPMDGRVLLVEDSDCHAALIAHLLEVMGMRVDRTSTTRGALSLLAEHTYQLAVIDIVLDDTKSGIALLRQLRRLLAVRIPVLMLSGLDDLPRRLSALQAGADDFLSKPFVTEEFVWRVRRLLQSAASEDLGELSGPAGTTADDKALWQSLSGREAQIGRLLVAGCNDKDIAARLHISYWTVRTHVQHIFTKLGVLNRRELMARFMNMDR